MRKILLSLTLVLAFACTQAQTERGDWMVGGSFQLNTSENNTQIALTPNAGLFVINNLAIGGNVIIDYSKVGDNKRTDIGIGPFIRYYFTQAKVRPILHGSFNFISSRNKTPLYSNTENGINYFLGGGAAIFISDQVSIDGLMGYAHSKYSDFDGSGGFALTIGFQVYLLKRQMDKVRGR
jgi:outer membrane protein